LPAAVTVKKHILYTNYAFPHIVNQYSYKTPYKNTFFHKCFSFL